MFSYKHYLAISSHTAYTNKDLKVIVKLAEIDKHIHFHTSRHTFATRALRKGMRIEYVSKILGHYSIKTTQVYAKIVNQDLDDAMGKFLNKKLIFNAKSLSLTISQMFEQRKY